MVSLANRHQVLTTDQKRFLIGLRMAEIGLDGSYKVHPDKIGKFNRIFGQFLNELKPGERCDKAECLTCDRLQTLLEDFHGKQESIEFQRFMEWFQKSTLIYNPAENSQPESGGSAMVISSDREASGLGDASPGPVSTPPAPQVAVSRADCAAPTPPPSPAPAAPEPLEASLVAPPPAKETPSAPLFKLDTEHHLIRQLEGLLERDTAMFDETGLRTYANRLQAAARQLMESLAKA